MSCNKVRESISAELDRETPSLGETYVAAHLSRCGACRAWRESAHRVTRNARLRTALPEGSAVALVAAAVRVDEQRRRHRWRWLVFASAVVGAGVVQLLATLPLLLMARSHTSGGGHVHALGSIELAIGAGFFIGGVVVLWRSRESVSPDVLSRVERPLPAVVPQAESSEVA
jgi:predicted anti-sigma-YlaC factor YlaD